MISIVICMKCKSTAVDICGWINKDTAYVRCCDCGHETTIEGFTLGKVAEDIKINDVDVAFPRLFYAGGTR